MAWNPSPEVAFARDLAAKLEAEQVIVIYLRRERGEMGSISYGATKALCKEAKDMANAAHNAILGGFKSWPE